MIDYPTEEDVNERIQAWHDLEYEGQIYEALGWTRGEWNDFVMHDVVPQRPLWDRED